MKARSFRRFITLAVILLVLLIFIASAILLYTTVKIQQGLLQKEPAYNGQQLYTRAVEQVDKGDYKQAEEYLERALSKEDDATYRNQLAVVKYRLKKYSEAIKQYEKLIASNTDPGFAWNGIGNAYRDWAEQEASKKVDYLNQAIDAYKQAVKADSKYVAAYSNWALLLANGGKKEEALTVIDAGIAQTGQEELKQVRSRLMVQ